MPKSSGEANETWMSLSDVERADHKRRLLWHGMFKAEIVQLCRAGDRSTSRVAKDLDLTDTAVREWVRQAYSPAYLRLDGLWQDHILTALTNDTWRPA